MNNMKKANSLKLSRTIASAIILTPLMLGSFLNKPASAGPIWNQADAEVKCPKEASKYGGTWTGGWWTTVWGKTSVCEVKSVVEAGPIWSNADAQTKCPNIAANYNGTWNGVPYQSEWKGGWWTTVWGKMSVCEIFTTLTPPDQL